MKNTWEGMDPDDIPGYVMDYVSSWLDKMDIKSLNDFDEKFQEDQFQDELQDFAEEIVKAGIESRK